jgi:short-subunit dehydrogenase
MTNFFMRALQSWRRRWWRPDPAALAAYAGLRPLVVVTGGSEGIGLELARQFALHGHDLLLIARRREVLDQAAARIKAETGIDVFVLPLDLTRPGLVEAIDAALAAHRAYADVVVNNAGIGLSGPFYQHAPEDVQRLLDLNIAALTRLTRHYLPGMRTRGQGGILNVGSLGGYIPGPNQAVYYASKAYVQSLTEAVAAETAGEGVRVCALVPGPVDTKFHERMGAENAFYRTLVPPSSAQAVARAGYRGYRLGWRITVPGLVNPFLALAMRILPHRIVIPIVGVLLQQRR